MTAALMAPSACPSAFPSPPRSRGKAPGRRLPNLIGRVKNLFSSQSPEPSQPASDDRDDSAPAEKEAPESCRNANPKNPKQAAASPPPRVWITGLGCDHHEPEHDSPEEDMAKSIDELWFACTEDAEVLEFGHYVHFHACFFRALRCDYDEADEARRAQADFAADAKGGLYVLRSRFAAMMRSLAQRWTTVGGLAHPAEAAGFMANLVQTVTFVEFDEGGAHRRRLVHPAVIALGSCIPRPGKSYARRTQRTRSESDGQPASTRTLLNMRRRIPSSSSSEDDAHAEGPASPKGGHRKSYPPLNRQSSLRRVALINSSLRLVSGGDLSPPSPSRAGSPHERLAPLNL